MHFCRKQLLTAGLLWVGVPFSSTYAYGDYLINTPIANSLALKKFKISTKYNGGKHSWERLTLAKSLFDGFEMRFSEPYISPGTKNAVVDFSYNIVPMIGSQVPGISVGVMDAGSEKALRRQFFVVATQQIDLDTDLNTDLRAQVSIGFEAGHKSNPFLGLEIPFGSQLKLLAEDDGISVNAGVRYYFDKAAYAELQSVNSKVQLKLSFTF